MSIGKQIHAFLEVSEIFFLQTRVDLVNHVWDTLEDVGIRRGDRDFDGCAPLAHHFIGSDGTRGTSVIGNQNVGVMLAYGQDGA
ncbi:hypothetical protein PQR64_35120 [Paraburkholderia phytofirmans]|uniref:hypothetical protein n=1 Tax=Paraburkholderia phytofirmans TaxID=261302 RepID=UPI0038BB79DD